MSKVNSYRVTYTEVVERTVLLMGDEEYMPITCPNCGRKTIKLRGMNRRCRCGWSVRYEEKGVLRIPEAAVEIAHAASNQQFIVLEECDDDTEWYTAALAAGKIHANADGDVWCAACHAPMGDFDSHGYEIYRALVDHQPTCKGASR